MRPLKESVMSISQPGTHAIGAEIPYRRSAMDKRTGSLVFDRHLDQKLAENPSSPARPKRG
jgi:hypothetical protein